MGASYATAFVPIFIMLIVIFITQRNEQAVIKKILRNRKTGDKEMLELAQKFLGKECIIYTFNAQITGTIKEVNKGGVLIEKSGNEEAVNIDFIVRIREYPRKKNGKKKSVVLD